MTDRDVGFTEANCTAFGAGDDALEFNGRTYRPNDTRSFVQFEMSYAFPNALVYKTAVHPHVLSLSWESLLYQQVNLEHQIKLYKVEAEEANAQNAEDRIVGSVLDAVFPPTPGGGWKVNPDPKAAPFISGVASFAKQAKGADRVIGRQKSGRHQFTVSLEINYHYSDSGFAVRLKKANSTANGKRPAGFADPKFDFTPDDLLAAGFEYVPTIKAPSDLNKTFSKTRNRIVSDWQGREVFLLMGGISTPVHYAGLAVVKTGAESTASMRMAASHRPDYVSPFSELASLLKKFQ